MTTTAPTTLDLWRHLGFLDLDGYLCVFSGKRPAPGSQKLEQTRQHFVPAKHMAEWAAGWLEGESNTGREAYFSVTLWQDRNRNRKNGAQPAKVRALWADGDGAVIPPGFPQPTAVVLSSPGRPHLYWALTAEQDAEQAEQLCKRIAYAIGADKGGWDIGQLLRPIGARNYKYDGAPQTTVDYIRDEAYRFADLDRMIPPLPADAETAKSGAGEPTTGGEPPFPMSDYAAEVWAGKRPTLKEDGSIDKSDSFWHLACELHDAGASPWLIRQVLVERDEALGWRHLAEKPADLDRVLGKLATKPRRPRPCHHAGHQGAGDCGHEPIIETQKAALATRDAELAELRAQTYNTMTILCGPEAAEYRIAKVVIPRIIHGEGVTPDSPTEQALTSLGALSRRSHLSEDVISKLLDASTRAGVGLEKTPYSSRVNPWTGEVSDQPRRYIAARPRGESLAATYAGYAAAPFEVFIPKKRTVKPKTEPTAPAQPAPLLVACPEHPDGGRHTRYETGRISRCDLCECALQIVMDDSNERLVNPEALPRPLAAVSEDAGSPVDGFLTTAASGLGATGTPRMTVIPRVHIGNRYCQEHGIYPHEIDRDGERCKACHSPWIVDAAGGGG